MVVQKIQKLKYLFWFSWSAITELRLTINLDEVLESGSAFLRYIFGQNERRKKNGRKKIIHQFIFEKCRKNIYYSVSKQIWQFLTTYAFIIWKIHNFYPIITKLSQNKVPIKTLFWKSFVNYDWIKIVDFLFNKSIGCSKLSNSLTHTVFFHAFVDLKNFLKLKWHLFFLKADKI